MGQLSTSLFNYGTNKLSLNVILFPKNSRNGAMFEDTTSGRVE